MFERIIEIQQTGGGGEFLYKLRAGGQGDGHGLWLPGCGYTYVAVDMTVKVFPAGNYDSIIFRIQILFLVPITCT